MQKTENSFSSRQNCILLTSFTEYSRGRHKARKSYNLSQRRFQHLPFIHVVPQKLATATIKCLECEIKSTHWVYYLPHNPVSRCEAQTLHYSVQREDLWPLFYVYVVLGDLIRRLNRTYTYTSSVHSFIVDSRVPFWLSYPMRTDQPHCRRSAASK